VELARLVTRDSMVGAEKVRAPGQPERQR